MAQLSEWLQIMLGEISRKQEEGQRAREEQHKREQEAAAPVRKLNDSSAPRR